MRCPAVELTIAPLRVRQWRQFYPRAADLPLFAALDQRRGGAGAADASGTAVTRDTLLALATAKDRRDAIATRLRHEIGRVLRISPDQIGGATSLDRLGFDSLLALELRNRLEAAFGVQLSATLIWNHPTIPAIVAYLTEAMNLPLASPVGDEPPSVEVRTEEHDRPEASWTAAVRQLSDEDALRELIG